MNLRVSEVLDCFHHVGVQLSISIVAQDVGPLIAEAPVHAPRLLRDRHSDHSYQPSLASRLITNYYQHVSHNDVSFVDERQHMRDLNRLVVRDPWIKDVLVLLCIPLH